MASSVHFLSAAVALLFLASFVTTSLDSHVNELGDHVNHLMFIAGAPCGEPQLKAIPVHKLFSEAQLYNKAFDPEVTMLHRCGCTGSCEQDGHKCAATEIEVVRRPFKVTHMVATEEHEKGSWSMEYHDLLNYKKCGCLPSVEESCCSDSE